MLSQTAEYALRAMVFMAMNAESSHTTEAISEKTRVPSGYLAKVMQALRRANLVSSQRGLGGGFVLTRRPEEISILEVINAVDPMQRIHSCPLDLASHGAVLCALHKRLDDAMSIVEKSFSSTTLAEILEKPTKSIPLCESISSPQDGEV